MFNLTFSKIKNFLNKVIDVLIPVVTVMLLLGIVFGPSAPVVGDIYTNVSSILAMLGEDGLLALVAIVIIIAYLNKNKE
jgi:purine-cytosine permease-like protein|tara:strand:- start:62 stop:298 length:237 start_codon:yes stop_codon:yes gene_type:complete